MYIIYANEGIKCCDFSTITKKCVETGYPKVVEKHRHSIRSYDIILPLQYKDIILHRERLMFWQSIISLSIEFQIVWLILVKNIIDISKQHFYNNNGFLIISILFNRLSICYV